MGGGPFTFVGTAFVFSAVPACSGDIQVQTNASACCCAYCFTAVAYARWFGRWVDDLVGGWVGVPCGTLVSVFGRVGGGPAILVFGTAVICILSPLYSRPALAYVGSIITIVDQLIAEFSTNRVRDRCTLVLEVAETHLTIVFNNQQQGAQQVGSSTQRYMNTKPALPVDPETTQPAAAYRPHSDSTPFTFLCSKVSGTKATTPLYDTVTNAIVSVGPIYAICLVHPNNKK